MEHSIENERVERMHASGHAMIKIMTGVTGFMATLILAAMMWGGTTLNGMQVTVGILESQLKIFNEQVASMRQEIKESTRSRYTSEQAANDRRLLEMEIKMLNGRIDGISEKVEAVRKQQ